MSPLPTMQALIFEAPGRLRLQEIPRPAPAAGEVLIRVAAAAICGTDLKIITGQKTRDVRIGYPVGHECAGTVAAVGAGVSNYQPGERVGVCVVVSCGQCRYCRADKENLCDSRITLGYHTDGAFAEYMLIPAHAVQRGNLFKLPESVDIDTATLFEPMACCINGQQEMRLGAKFDPASQDSPESLIIFGAGPIGLIHLLLAQAKGLKPITVVEPSAYRRQVAAALKVDVVCSPDEINDTEQYDAAILAVGIPELAAKATRIVKRCGKISLFAGFPAGSTAAIDPNMIHYKQLRITGASESRRRDYAEAMALVMQKKVDPAVLITHRYPLDEYAQAFQKAQDGTALKVMFQM